jgi:DNA polymerase III delta subunit
MSIYRFWWMDDSDHAEVEWRIASIRSQLSSWEWTHWEEDPLLPQASAGMLEESIGTAPLFGEGRVVCIRRLPEKVDLAPMLSLIAEGVLLVLIAPISEANPIFKAAKALPPDFVKIRKMGPTPSDAMEWVKNRAGSLGISIDEEASRAMLDAMGMNAGRLYMELLKLKHASPDGKIGRGLVMSTCSGTGQVLIENFSKTLIDGNEEAGQESLRRLIHGGFHPNEIIGRLASWSRGLAIAESCGRKFPDSAKEIVAALRAVPKPRTKEEIEKDMRKTMSEIAAEYGKASKTPLLYAKPGRIYYACKELSGKPKYCGYKIMRLVLDAQMALRLRRGEETRTLADFVSSVCNVIREGK